MTRSRPHTRERARGGAGAHVQLIVALLSLLLSVVLPQMLPAQWVVDAAAGLGEQGPAAARVGTRSAILALRHDGPRWLYLSGGLPLDSDGLPWAATGAGARWRSRPLGPSVGVDLAAHGHAYRASALDASGAGAVLEVLPSLGWGAESTRLDIHAGLLHYSSVFDGVTEARSLLDTGGRITSHPRGGVVLRAETRYLRAEEGGYPYAGASAEVELGSAALTGHLGRWLASELDEAEWGLGGHVLLGGRTRVYASLEQEAPHPLYWNETRRSWTIGLSRALGASARSSAPAAPVPVATGGMVEIRIPASDAESAPSVAGDFNEWEPVPMQRTGDVWTLSLPLEPGVYRYAFRRGDGTWFVPESVPNRVDDGFGGTNAVLMVAAPPAP